VFHIFIVHNVPEAAIHSRDNPDIESHTEATQRHKKVYDGGEGEEDDSCLYYPKTEAQHSSAL
jgi:hypothetical protein